MLLKFVAVSASPVVPLAVSKIPDANLVLNFLMLVVLLFGAPRFFRSKQAEASLAEKDQTIATHEQSLSATRARIDTLDHDLTDIRARNDELIERNRKLSEVAAGFQARYEEAQKYTAKEALRTLEQAMSHQADESERRHLELMAAMRSMSDLLGERRSNSRRRDDDAPIP